MQYLFGIIKEDPKIMVNALLYLDAYHKEETQAFTEAIQSLKQSEKSTRVWRNLLLDKDDDLLPAPKRAFDLPRSSKAIFNYFATIVFNVISIHLFGNFGYFFSTHSKLF